MKKEELEEIYSPSEMDKESFINFGLGKIPTSLAPFPLFIFVGGLIFFFIVGKEFGLVAGVIISFSPTLVCVSLLKMFYIDKPAHYAADSRKKIIQSITNEKNVLGRKHKVTINPIFDLERDNE